MSEEKRKKDNQLKDAELKDEELDKVSGGELCMFEECEKCGKLLLTPARGSWTCPVCGTDYMRIGRPYDEDW